LYLRNARALRLGHDVADEEARDEAAGRRCEDERGDAQRSLEPGASGVHEALDDVDEDDQEDGRTARDDADGDGEEPTEAGPEDSDEQADARGETVGPRHVGLAAYRVSRLDAPCARQVDCSPSLGRERHALHGRTA